MGPGLFSDRYPTAYRDGSETGAELGEFHRRPRSGNVGLHEAREGRTELCALLPHPVQLECGEGLGVGDQLDASDAARRAR